MTEINVDDDKYEVLRVRGKEKGYDNPEDYIDHLLSQVVEKIKREKQEDEEYSREEEEEVKEKLKDLGYM